MDPHYREYVRWALRNIDRGFIAGLRGQRTAPVLMATAVLWLQLILSWSLALLGPLWFVPCCFIANVVVVQAMLLWTHEASHFHLWRSERWNDLWCNIFFSAPIGISVQAYRATHLTHHANLGTDRDEDRETYRFAIKGYRALGRFFLETLLGYAGIADALRKYAGPRDGRGGRERLAQLLPAALFNIMFLALCVLAGRWYLYFALWLYPVVAVGIALNGIRTIAEHQSEACAIDGEPKPVVRITMPGPFEKWLLYQTNFNFHVEHHLYPEVPRHNLVRLHRRLFEGGFYERFPQARQSSGIGRFIQLSRSRVTAEFSAPASGAPST